MALFVIKGYWTSHSFHFRRHIMWKTKHK